MHKAEVIYDILRIQSYSLIGEGQFKEPVGAHLSNTFDWFKIKSGKKEKEIGHKTIPCHPNK